MQTVNIGILAHVDAGKTTLTEAILYETGVIGAIGSVDQGTTQTDTLELERQRGITIQSAVVSFRLGDLKINLIDTPGHPDFIAEVERALGVLDGVVLVVSAVEGVQSQTRRLARAIATAGIPIIVFANKIDRQGARDIELLDDIRRKLGLRVIALNTVSGIGSPDARVLAKSHRDPEHSESLIDILTETNDDLLGAWLRDADPIDPQALDVELVAQMRRRLIVPVIFGSARTGQGVDQVLAGVARFMPPADGCGGDPLTGTVFKIQRTRNGEKIVYARLYSGRIESRERVPFRRLAPGEPTLAYESRITGIDAFDDGRQKQVAFAQAGDIVRLHGLKETMIGDYLGCEPGGRPRAAFPPPIMESVVSAHDPVLRPQLNSALAGLAEQDPLISIRRDTRRGAISVRLYGEVQKEVIAATLTDDYGVDAIFEPSQVICVETPIGVGAAVEHMGGAGNPFVATVGLHIEPCAAGNGITYKRELGSLPLSYYTAIEETVYATFEEGLHGWRVIDCQVTLTDVAFASPVTTAADFRNLTPLVLMTALRRARTHVLEPVERFTLDTPEDCLGDALAAIGAARGQVQQNEWHGNGWRLAGTIPSSEVHAFEQRLPGITRGGGDFESRFDAYAPVVGPAPTRPRTDFNPLDRKFYLAQVSQS
ncbi:MAG: TetM/TetW/TetO/TetS family tetracycline resistance ribosomal protection protein [Chloroflexia bacterium]|nr:TetM/TetW/TetO/TetS family tetracycline resistance ribosomal protection protein [Chloroflexia bacterium]